MKTFNIQTLKAAVLGVFILAGGVEIHGQGFHLSAKPSTGSIQTGNPITYTFALTNQSGFTLSDLWVTNSFSAPVTVDSINFTVGNGVNYSGVSYISSNQIVLDFQQFRPATLTSGSAQATMTITPQGNGSHTNFSLKDAVFAIAPSLQTSANTASTNVVVLVTNSLFQADLGVLLSGFNPSILAGDLFAYSVLVTNHGPGSVANVFLTNTLPRGTTLINISSTNHLSVLTNGQIVLGLGTLTNSSSLAVQLTVQPTNTGQFPFSASVGAAGLQDTFSANNTANTNINVGIGITGLIIATNGTPMRLNPQVGLMEQTVRLVNISTSSVASARLTVSGLTNWLYNAVGTNYANPFVIYNSTLDPGQSVDLILEYFIPTRQPIAVPDSHYTAVGVPGFNLTASSKTNGATIVTKTVLLMTGRLLIEFPSVQGADYSIIYSPDVTFSNALLAQPDIIAPADRVQWIDSGPPKTVSPPSSATSRFYRVIRN